MHVSKTEQLSRRAFLRRSAQLASTGVALPLALNIAAMGEAAALTATDYKALVCVFLYGGCDYANTVITADDTRYAQYAKIRGDGRTDGTASGIALAKADLAATLLQPDTPLPDGMLYALHPAMRGMADLFNKGQAAVQLNVGPLVVPLTRQQYLSPDRTKYPLPPRLGSHNDQQSVWQSSGAEGSTAGWGGRIGDLALSNNARSLFTCMSAGGAAVFLSGERATAYQVGTAGAVKISGVTAPVYRSAAVQRAMGTLVRTPAYPHLLETAYTQVTDRAVGAEASIAEALAGPGADGTLFSAFTTPMLSSNGLAAQLKMVARLIAARQNLGAKRQVFFVGLGGFDLHDHLIANQATLLTRVSEGMTAFHETMVKLGMANQVTAFTASDFGRTLVSNGDGSDHGWGGHHFVVGGAVNGRAFYGKAPPVSITNSVSDANDQWHIGGGRLLPSTAQAQYAATLARWFGVSETDLNTVVPQIANFGGADYPTDLGFMRMD